MKKLLFFATLLFTITFVACNKDEDEGTTKEDNVITTEDLLATEDVVFDAEDEVDDIIENQFSEVEVRDDCPTKTVTPAGNNYPKTITLDYGNGCTGPRGRVKKGKIVVEISAPMNQAGATRKLTFMDYYVDSAKVEGFTTLVNSRSDNNNPSFTRTTDVTITFPDGDKASWKGTHTHKVVSGGNTPRRFDDVIEITGNSMITNRDGRSFSSEIIEPLRRAIVCPWISDGIRQVSRNGNEATIDYGFGEPCDNKAQVTLPNGETRVIRIEPWWRR
ncbi:MAG: hypothetical protein ACK4TA_15800 [Saprospiraceae bacterium]